MTTSGTSGISGLVTRLEAERNRMRIALEEQLAVAERSGRTQMSPSERRALADIRSVEQRLDDLRSELSRAGVDRLLVAARRLAQTPDDGPLLRHPSKKS